jgi:hypothetical protein
VRRYVSFSETVGAVWRHLSGKPRPTQRERWLAELAIERLAEELLADEEPETSLMRQNGDETSLRDESHSLTGGGG